jgi:hypothetical protein
MLKRMPAIRLRSPATILLLLTLAQFFHSVFDFEPPSQILNDEAIYPFDYATGYYLIESAKERFRTIGQLHGYDPYFMAGHPEVYLENNNILITLLATFVLPFLSSGLVMKLFYLVGLTLAPWALYASFRNFDVGVRGALAGTLLGLTYMRVGEFALAETGGALASVLLFLFALPYLSFYYRFLRYGERSSAILFSLLTPLLPLLHKNLIVILPIPVLLLFWIYRSGYRHWHLVLYAVLGGVAVWANGFWLFPCIAGLPYISSDPLPLWLNFDARKILVDYASPTVGFSDFCLPGTYYGTLFTRQLILLLAIFGSFRWWKKRTCQPLCVVLLLSAGFYLLFSYCGSYIKPLQLFEPYRYSIWMNFLLLVPASAALDAFLTRPARRRGVRCSFLSRAGMVLGVVSILNLLPSCARLLQIHPHRILAKGYLDEVIALEDWLIAHTDRTSRILLEEAGASLGRDREGPYRDSFAIGIVALRTRREFLNARYPFYRISFRFSSFFNGKAFGQRIDQMDPATLRSYLDLYNCGWIISWNEGCVRALRERFSFLTEQDRIGHFVIFRVHDPMRSYLLKGSGRTTSGFFGIQVDDMEPDEGEVILRYHYVPGMRADPSAVIEEVRVCDDPHGFIRLVNPPRSLRLYCP